MYSDPKKYITPNKYSVIKKPRQRQGEFYQEPNLGDGKLYIPGNYGGDYDDRDDYNEKPRKHY